MKILGRKKAPDLGIVVVKSQYIFIFKEWSKKKGETVNGRREKVEVNKAKKERNEKRRD